MILKQVDCLLLPTTPIAAPNIGQTEVVKLLEPLAVILLLGVHGSSEKEGNAGHDRDKLEEWKIGRMEWWNAGVME